MCTGNVQSVPEPTTLEIHYRQLTLFTGGIKLCIVWWKMEQA